MTTNLSSIDNRVNLLTLSGITLLDLDEVASWLSACDFCEKQLREACQHVLAEGEYTFSNIEHRLTVELRQRE